MTELLEDLMEKTAVYNTKKGVLIGAKMDQSNDRSQSHILCPITRHPCEGDLFPSMRRLRLRSQGWVVATLPRKFVNEGSCNCAVVARSERPLQPGCGRHSLDRPAVGFLPIMTLILC